MSAPSPGEEQQVCWSGRLPPSIFTSSRLTLFELQGVQFGVKGRSALISYLHTQM